MGQEGVGGQQAPALVGFMFGNVEADGKVEADYLDEEAKDHLSGLARLQGGAVDDLEAELQADGSQAPGASGAAVRPAPDARDFADEAELIEDAEAAAAAAAAAAAEQRRQLGVVTVALQAGAGAEEEDYDFDEEEQPQAGGPRAAALLAAPPAALPAPLYALPPAAVLGLPGSAAAAAAAPTVPAAAPGPAVPQLVAAQQLHVRLPVLGRSPDGETVLRFSELYGFQGVMAGHVASPDELLPPPLLPRGQQRAAAGAKRRTQAEADAEAVADVDDEEAVMLAADVEVPPDEEEVDEKEELPKQQQQQQQQQHGVEPAAVPGTAPQGPRPQQQGSQLPQRTRNSRHVHEPAPQPAAAEDAALAADGHEATAEGAPGGSGSASDTTFAPVNTLPWEDKVCWKGHVPAGAESEHETDDEHAAAGAVAGIARPAALAAWEHGGQGAPLDVIAAGQQQQQEDGYAAYHQDGGEEQQHLAGEQQQWGQPLEPPLPQQEQPLLHADIAAMFAQQTQPQQVQQQALASTQFGNGLPVVFMPGGGDAGQQQPQAQQQEVPAWGQQQDTLQAWQQQQQQQQQFGLQAAGTQVFLEPVVELPGLSSAAAEEVAARAAAESDEEEYLALPTAPLLRLELLSLAGGGGEDVRLPLHPAPEMLPVHRDTWEERIAWEGVKNAERIRFKGAVFDLNDPHQAFELTHPVGAAPHHATAAGRAAGGARDISALVTKAAALILQPQAAQLPLPPRGSGFDATNPEEVELWRLQQGLAREREYHQLSRRKAGTAATVRVQHAKLATDLATIPILNPTPQNQEEVLALALWHTPRGKWWPLEVGRVALNIGGKKGSKAGASGPVTVSISSLAGLNKVFQVALDTQLGDLWKHLVENTLFKAAASNQPLILLPGCPPTPLALDQPLRATGAVKEGQKQVKLSVAFQAIELLRSDIITAVPSNDNPALLRPPTAFTRKRDFSAAEPGHVVLLEYMEQQPPLLNRPGMGAKLVTYYRKQDAADKGHQKLKQESPRWRVGAVQPLGDDDDSPFLGQLSKGSSSLSVESGLYRSLAFPYDPPHTDFLLMRTPAGAMQLRELNGTVVVGQQLPMLRVPAPTAREVKDLEERRIYVYVFKHLRRQQAKLDKDPTKLGQQATITLKTLAEAFPSRPPAMIRAYLKDACDLAVRPLGDNEIFSLKEGARPPSEAELRKKLTPEETCTLEACYVAAFRMKQRGLVMHEKLDKAAIEKLRLAAEMLPPDDNFQKAARLVEQAMQSAPWTLTDAFVTHFREGKAQLQLAGAADPTGRGFGYSFVRDVRHKHANSDDVTKQMAKRQAGKVQGTDADLRRMTTAQARERLRGYGLTEDEIQGLGRWTMIDMVRQLASAAAQDGTVDAAAVKFVRHQKTTLIELQRRAAEKAQQILEKQMAVLNNTAGEDLGDQDALEAELERELAASEAAEAEATAGPTPQAKKGKRDGTPTPDDEQRMMQQMRAEGLMATPAGGAAPGLAAAAGAGSGTPPAGSGGPPPKDGPGTKRIRREVFLKAANGSWQKSHEIIYVGRDRPGQLHSLYQKEGAGNYPYGFGTRTIAGRPKELRLSYAAARGRGIGRSARAGPAGGRGRGGRGRGSKAAAVEEASPEVARGRQSSRQRKQRQFADDVLDGDEMLSDDGDFEYNEEAEAPYFAMPAEPRQPKQKKKKKKLEEAPGEEGQAAGLLAALPLGAASALPDDFAAALAQATMVRAPSTGAALEEQQQQQQQQVSAGGALQNGQQPKQEELQAFVQQPAQALPPQDVQQPALRPEPEAAAAPSMPKLKIKLGSAAPAKREPSPEFVYDFTAPGEEEEDEQQGRRAGKAKDADYEAPEADDGSEDEFVPDDEEISEEEGEERQFMKKARRSRNYEGLSMARTASRRSAGSARTKGGGGSRSKAGGGGGARKKAGGGGSGARKGGGGSAGGGARRKRSRADYEDMEFEEEEFEDVELSDDDDVETLDDEDEAGTSDDAGTAQPSIQHRPAACAVGAMVAAGRPLGAILASIVQQLRSIKKPFGIGGKPSKVYELVFGKLPSTRHAPDYHTWVPKPQAITVADLQKKAKGNRYISLSQFREDVNQLYQNALKYNTTGNGQYGDPYFIQLAKELGEDVEMLIAQNLAEIQQAEIAAHTSGYQQQHQQQIFGYGGQQPF